LNNVPPPNESTPTIEDILKLHDKAFVVKAYAVILGRTPDSGGLANYLTQVRAGTHKAQIVAELAESPEGRHQSVELPGLQSVIRRYRKRAPSRWARWMRRGSRGDTESTERQLRAIENQLYLLDQRFSEQVRHLSDLLTLVLTKMATSDATSFSHPGQTSESGSALSGAQVSPSVARTFAELKAAIANSPAKD
jgi:Domain of unknown function (DUF4214)